MQITKHFNRLETYGWWHTLFNQRQNHFLFVIRPQKTDHFFMCPKKGYRKLQSKRRGAIGSDAVVPDTLFSDCGGDLRLLENSSERGGAFGPDVVQRETARGLGGGTVREQVRVNGR